MNFPFYPATGKMQGKKRILIMCSRMSRYLVLLLALAITACAMVNFPQQQRKAAVDDFMYALRWLRFQEAATFFSSEHQQAFLDQMDGLKDLNVTEVRLKRFDLKDEGRRAEARLEMDYYILPSATLKTLRIDQTWVYFEAGDSGYNGFLITTPFPEFPEETARNKSPGKATLPP